MRREGVYVRGLVDHNTEVIKEIYDNYAERIRKHIVGNGGTSEDAKDVFHNALMVIYQKAKTGDLVLTSRFYTYLFSVCHFIWERENRKKSNNTLAIETPDKLIDPEDIETQIEQRERHNIFRTQFAKLETLCRQILELFFQQKTMAEIAERLQLKNEHTARTRKYRCQKTLEDLVRADSRYRELNQHRKR